MRTDINMIGDIDEIKVLETTELHQGSLVAFTAIILHQHRVMGMLLAATAAAASVTATLIDMTLWVYNSMFFIHCILIHCYKHIC